MKRISAFTMALAAVLAISIAQREVIADDNGGGAGAAGTLLPKILVDSTSFPNDPPGSLTFIPTRLPNSAATAAPAGQVVVSPNSSGGYPKLEVVISPKLVTDSSFVTSLKLVLAPAPGISIAPRKAIAGDNGEITLLPKILVDSTSFPNDPAGSLKFIPKRLPDSTVTAAPNQVIISPNDSSAATAGYPDLKVVLSPKLIVDSTTFVISPKLALDSFQVLTLAPKVIADSTFESPFSTIHFTVEGGVLSLSPSTIKDQVTQGMQGSAAQPRPQAFYLDKAGTADVLGFVQVRLRNRYAWNWARSYRQLQEVDENATKDPAELKRRQETYGGLDSKFYGLGTLLCLGNWLHVASDKTLMIDHDLRIGATFGGNSSSVSATTVAGTGDLSAMVDLGLLAFRSYSDGIFSSIDFPEIVVEGNTDRNFERTHGRFGAGIGWALGVSEKAIPIPGITDKPPSRVYEFDLRVTGNAIDTPELSGGFTTMTELMDTKPVVLTNSIGRPEFRYVAAGGADIDFQLPFGKTGYLNFGASFYGGNLFGANLNPSPWVVHLGTTLPIDKFLGIFSAPINGLFSQ